MTENNYEALWTCYLTGQMSEAQLQIHMSEDKDFAEFVERRRKEIRAQTSPQSD